eukprot:SAG11_NODE_3223_length_2601_cov_2.196643_2_plen_204_part_00
MKWQGFADDEATWEPFDRECEPFRAFEAERCVPHHMLLVHWDDQSFSCQTWSQIMIWACGQSMPNVCRLRVGEEAKVERARMEVGRREKKLKREKDEVRGERMNCGSGRGCVCANELYFMAIYLARCRERRWSARKRRVIGRGRQPRPAPRHSPRAGAHSVDANKNMYAKYKYINRFSHLINCHSFCGAVASRNNDRERRKRE